jgi:hypothetical protein
MADPTYGKSFAQREAEKSRSFLQRDNVFESSAEKDVGEQLGNLLDTSEEWSANDSLMASRLFIDGLWLNKADEVGSWVGAAAVKVFGGAGSEKPISEIRQEMLTSLNAEQARFYEERPGVAIAANIAGGILSPVGLKGGQLLSRAKDVRNSALAMQASDEVAGALSSIGRISPAAVRPVQAGTAAGQAAGASTVAALQATGQGAVAATRGGASLAQQLSGFSPQAYNILGRTPTPVLAAGAAAIEGGIIGAEGETAGEIAKNALTSAILGAGFSTLISGGGMAVNAALRTNTAQELGKGADFVSLMFTDNFAAPVYRHVVSKAFGATSFMENQARLLAARMPNIQALKDRGVNIVNNAAMKLAQSKGVIASQGDNAIARAKQMADNLQEELTAGKAIKLEDLDSASRARIAALRGEGGETLEQIQAAAAREAEISTNAVEGAFRTQAFQSSLPVGAPANLAEEIQAMSPREALQAVRDAWSAFGYRAAKDAKIPVDRTKMTGDIESLIRNAPEYALLDSPGTVGLATRMSDYIDSILTRELGYADGIVSGETMVRIRSDLGFAINGLSQNNPAAKAIVKPIQKYIDDLISKNLSGKAADDFAEESKLWRVKSTLEDAASASVAKEGAFSGEDWVNAVQGQDWFNASVGKGILQLEAEAAAALRNASNQGIEGVRDNSIKRVQQNTDRLVRDEQARLRSAKNVATTEYRRQVKAINDEYAASASRTAGSRGKMERLTDALDKWKAQMREIDSQVAKLEDAQKRLKRFMPSGDNTIFEQMFATGLLAGAVGLGAYAGGPGGAVGGIAGGVALATALTRPGTQRFLAGQTGAQKSGAALADILSDVSNRIESRFGMSSSRVAGQSAAQPTREGVMFNNEVKASIRRLPDARKAQILMSIERSGKLEALKAEDPGFYRELAAAR